MPDSHAHIARLPAVLANQIAAGEVVERPASVVKELVENAIDAGAARIRVEVEDGGVRRIRVTDDGSGIEADELSLALSRHATSKVCSFEDLSRVATLGFRGEALPSIASVSRLRLTSRRAGADTAWQVDVEGAVVDGAPVPAALDVGTTVEVRDLFFNTPARRRFLRTNRTEYLHVEEVVRRAALATPGVAFELWRDGRRTLRARPATDAAETQRRLTNLCGAAFARAALPFSAAGPDAQVHGWLLGSAEGRAHADLQHVCVNARVVRDPLLRHALRAAFEGLLVEGRQPAYVVYLDIAAEAVDVNVHPTKHELRFREARMVHDFVRSAARRVLGGTQMEAMEDTGGDGEQTVPDHAHADGGLDLPVHTAAGPPGQSTGGVASGPRPRHLHGWREVAAYAPLARPPALRATAGAADACGLATAVWLSTRFVLLGPHAGAYWLVDLQAVAAAEFASRGGQRAQVSVPLLLPAARTLEVAVADRLDTVAEVLAELGLQLRRTGPTEVVLMEVPAAAAHVDPATLWAAIGDWAGGSAATTPEAASLAERLAVAVAAQAAAAPRERRQAWLQSARVAIEGGDPAAQIARRLDDAHLAALFVAGH